jgi:hypothetical protein
MATDTETTRSWLEGFSKGLFKNVRLKKRQDGSKYPCPCCGYKTLPERGGFDICPVCFWEDDGQDDHDAEVVRGGPNYSLSLTQARANFQAIGACEERCLPHVRAVKEKEL